MKESLLSFTAAAPEETLPLLKRIAPLALALGLALFLLWPWVQGTGGMSAAQTPPAAPSAEVRVGVYNTAPLFFMEGGQAKGLTIDLLRDVAKREGWRLTFVPGTWDECLGRLRSGEIDLLPNITETVERNREFRFTKEFLFLEWATIYKKKGSPIRSVLDLKGKTITALRGSIFTEDLKRLLEQFGVQAYIVTKHEYAEVMASVARGDADAGVCPNVLGGTLERTYAVTPTDIMFAPTNIRSAVKRGGREDLLPALDRHLSSLKAQPGSLFYQLRDKWLGLAEGDHPLPYWLPWALGAGLLTLGLLAAFVLSLRVLVQRRTRELAESEQRYRIMVDDQTELVSRFDAAGTFLFVNQGFCRFFGKTPEELLGSVWAPVVLEEDLPLVRERMASLGPDNPLVMVENRNRNAEGEVRWVQFVNRAFFDDKGRLKEIQSVGRDITHQKESENALRESEARYLATLTAVNDGLWDWHVPSGQAYFSPLYYGLLGYKDNEFTASYANWQQLVHPEDLDRTEHDLLQAIESGQGFSIDLRMRTQDGGWKWVATRGKAIETDAEGKTLRAVGTLSDITERKELEARLRESERHFRTLANSGQALIWTSGPDKLCTYFNEPWLAFTGRSLEQELGNGWAEGVHPEDFQRCLEIYVAAFDARQSFSMEYRLRHASGEYRWIVDQGTPRYDSQGGFLGYIGHCLDITERMQAGEAMRESEDRFRMLFENAPLPYQSLNEQGYFLDVNRKWLEALGYEKQEVLGKWFGDFLGQGYKEHFDKNFPMFKQCCMIDGVEFDMVRKDGHIIRASFNGRVQLGKNGEFLRTHCIFTDITERKLAEEELLAAKEAAETANRSKSEFLANMSHELRTPMNGVLGMLQLLMLEELKPSQQSYANNAFEAANRLLSLLNDILDFSRIEAGVLVFKDEPFNPADILAATVGVFGHICERKGLALSIRPDPGLPASLLGDEARIRQIVFNLVGNAVKFTRQGAVSIEAWHRVPPGSGPARLYLAVSDTGVGIPESKLDSVFDRFSQVDGSYTRQFEGAGLGLAIVRRIVESLGGALCIDSEAGAGTAVVLVLPALATPAEVLAAHNAAAAAEPEEAVPLRILLAEDELIGQLGARLMLERMGHTVVAVNDGKAAVAAALEREFDCVLMDIQMPEMDGLEATRILRNTSLPGARGSLPIIAMTAYALSGDREKFLAAGMDEYIAKPFQQDDLRALLQMVARRRRQAALH